MTPPETTRPPSRQDPPGPEEISASSLADYGISEAEWTQAVVLAQRAVRQRMFATRRGYRAEDAASLVPSELWWSLPRWASLSPRPALAAWARSHAASRNTVRRWEREEDPLRAPGGMAMVLLDSLPSEPVAMDPHPVRREAADASALVHELRSRVLARPGGSALWDLIVTNVEHGSRGRRARRVALDVLGDIARDREVDR